MVKCVGWPARQAELYDGFSDPGFQEAWSWVSRGWVGLLELESLHGPMGLQSPSNSQALAELEAIHGKAYRNYTDDHTKLFLTVQNKARRFLYEDSSRSIVFLDV